VIGQLHHRVPEVDTVSAARRSPAFPLSLLPSRMVCPNCGERSVLLTFDIPGASVPKFVPEWYRR
jgi:hypothetical protein